MKPKVLVAFFDVIPHGWHPSISLTTRKPRSFSPKLISSWLAPSNVLVNNVIPAGAFHFVEFHVIHLCPVL